MEDKANIVLSGDEAAAFLKNLNNPPESVRRARQAFLNDIIREGLPYAEEGNYSKQQDGRRVRGDY